MVARKKRFRFALRHLLLTMLVVAAYFGGKMSERSRRELAEQKAKAAKEEIDAILAREAEYTESLDLGGRNKFNYYMSPFRAKPRRDLDASQRDRPIRRSGADVPEAIDEGMLLDEHERRPGLRWPVKQKKYLN